MAGFADNKNSMKRFSPVGERLKELSKLGMKYDDMVIKNSMAIGITENKANINQYNNDSDDMYLQFANFALNDIGSKKNIVQYDSSYTKTREELRQLALQDEIEEILDTITDESIITDDSNYIAYPVVTGGSIKQEIKDEVQEIYNRLYQYFNFGDGISAWNYFRKFLIDGYIAFEIIYNDKETEIIGFKEIDPISLAPGIDKESGKKVWVQYKGQSNKERILFDSQIIYIAFSSSNMSYRVSYVARLVRSFNLLRVMEHTRIIWAVTNASYKMKFVIPVGGKSKTRAKESLGTLMQNYRETVDFNNDNGSITTNGKPMMAFNKEYWLPSKDGETPEIETLSNDGPDLSDVESLKWFQDKLKLASKIPFSRFLKDGSSTFTNSGDGMDREEIKFSKFINRLRSQFQEILVKPLYIQMCLKFPELVDDFDFKSNLSIKFIKDNVFQELKDIELSEKRIDYISQINDSLVTTDQEGNDTKYFDIEFLIERYGGFTQEDLKLNKRFKDKKILEAEGYTIEDIEQILDGEPKSNFTPENKDKEEDPKKESDESDDNNTKSEKPEDAEEEPESNEEGEEKPDSEEESDPLELPEIE